MVFGTQVSLTTCPFNYLFCAIACLRVFTSPKYLRKPCLPHSPKGNSRRALGDGTRKPREVTVSRNQSIDNGTGNERYSVAIYVAHNSVQLGPDTVIHFQIFQCSTVKMIANLTGHKRFNLEINSREILYTNICIYIFFIIMN